MPESSSFTRFWPGRQTSQIQQSYPCPSSVKKPTSQSRTTVLAMATVRVKNESHILKLSQNHSPSQSQSQKPGHGHCQSKPNSCHNQSHSHKFFLNQKHFELDQLGKTFTLVNLPFLLITSNAGHGHSHRPSHSLA